MTKTKTNKKWTEDEIQLLKDNFKGKSRKEWGVLLNRTERSVEAKYLELGLKKKVFAINRSEYIGKKFERLLIKAESNKIVDGKRCVKCLCDCGKKYIKKICRILSGNTHSCGCIQKEITANRNITHNLSSHPLYSIWCGIKSRCYNSNEIVNLFHEKNKIGIEQIQSESLLKVRNIILRG